MRNTRKMFLKSLVTVSFAVTGLLAANSAKAQEVDFVTMTFQSGATFTGTVDFASGYTSVTGVSGVLKGYQYGTSGYVGGSSSDLIDWVWFPGSNYSSGPDDFGTFLMDGPQNNYSAFSDWIQFTYNYSSAPALTFANVGVYDTPNYVDYNDPFVSGSISSVPEGGAFSLYLLLAGAACFGAIFFRSRNTFASHAQA
jgi:hypothetical protein